jgi:hypothetical protein
MPQPGDVFIVKNYKFEDGSQKDKWFIVLNASDLQKPCLVLKTTSRPERYPGCVRGCNKSQRCFFAPTTWQTCFALDTYIQLPQIIEFPAANLLKDRFAGKIEFKLPLTTDCLAQLRSCLATFKDDISQSHWALVYKAKS